MRKKTKPATKPEPKLFFHPSPAFSINNHARGASANHAKMLKSKSGYASASRIPDETGSNVLESIFGNRMVNERGVWQMRHDCASRACLCEGRRSRRPVKNQETRTARTLSLPRKTTSSVLR